MVVSGPRPVGHVGNRLDLPPSLFGEESAVNAGAAPIVVAALGIRQSARVTAGLAAQPASSPRQPASTSCST